MARTGDDILIQLLFAVIFSMTYLSFLFPLDLITLAVWGVLLGKRPDGWRGYPLLILMYPYAVSLIGFMFYDADMRALVYSLFPLFYTMALVTAGKELKMALPVVAVVAFVALI